jgi:hypothetical protein
VGTHGHNYGRKESLTFVTLGLHLPISNRFNLCNGYMCMFNCAGPQKNWAKRLCGLVSRAIGPMVRDLKWFAVEKRLLLVAGDAWQHYSQPYV